MIPNLNADLLGKIFADDVTREQRGRWKEEASALDRVFGIAGGDGTEEIADRAFFIWDDPLT